MPHPVRPDTAVNARPGVIKERPGNAIGIALVLSEWTALEIDLILLVTFALYSDAPDSEEAVNISMKAWDAMESLKARLDFIQSAVEKRIPDYMRDLFVRCVIPEVRKRASERNRIVHGQWYTSDEYPDDLILVYRREPWMRYSVKDFEDIAQRIQETGSMVNEFWLHVKRDRDPQ